MADEWFAPDLRRPPTLPAKGHIEQLFSIQRADGTAVVGELVDHGEFGVEVQVVQDGKLLFSRRFDSHELARQWAQDEQNNL
jgi:hypothetical protein